MEHLLEELELGGGEGEEEEEERQERWDHFVVRGRMGRERCGVCSAMLCNVYGYTWMRTA